MSFYKFRSIINSDLSKDYALDALLSSKAIFSSRKNFNDLFDSKINIQYPTPDELLKLFQDPRLGSAAPDYTKWISAGAFTSEGLRELQDTEAKLNRLFDSYPIYCLSSSNNDSCHVLWAHYAKNHTGFCIEFKFPDPQNQPKEVTYKPHIETLGLSPGVRQTVKRVVTVR